MKIIQLHISEQKLIEKARRNSRRAQKELFDRFSSKMLSVCRYYVKDMHEAEDRMLIGFFKAFQHLDSYNNDGKFQAWLRKIMVNECISFLRSKKEVYAVDEIETHTTVVDNSVLEHYDVAEIQELIDQLPEGYKMVFILYAIEGYKHHEIARMLEISENTSKSQLFKARKQLQQKIVQLKLKKNGTV